MNAYDVVNAAANFWKHHSEWPEPNKGHLEEATRAILDSLCPPRKAPSRSKTGATEERALSDEDYVLSGVLYELIRARPARFASVVPLLRDWRDGLLKGRPK